LFGAGYSHPCILATGEADLSAIDRYNVKSGRAGRMEHGRKVYSNRMFKTFIILCKIYKSLILQTLWIWGFVILRAIWFLGCTLVVGILFTFYSREGIRISAFVFERRF